MQDFYILLEGTAVYKESRKSTINKITLMAFKIMPSLLHGAGTLVCSSKETDTLCEELQLLFWRRVYQVPKGTPKVMLRTQSTSMKRKQRIWKMKLKMAKKILSQEKTLAKEIYGRIH